MQRIATIFLAQDPADAATLRGLGANVSVVGERIGLADSGNVVLVARDGGGRELLKGMNLGLTGRFIDLGAQSLADFLQTADDPIGLLEEKAQDIFWHEERPLLNWDAPPSVQGQSSGITFLDKYLRWTCPELVIIAGPCGCGKSTFARLLGYQWVDSIGRRNNTRLSIVGWEDRLSTVKREVERYALRGKTSGALSSDQARRLVDMESRIGWTQRHPDEDRLIDWYCELVEHRCRSRHAARFFVFDPFNEHDATRAPNQTETQYVGEMMKKFRKMVDRLGIILIVVTHVSAKSYDESGAIKPFRVANASGSVQFGNKADRGICILRTNALSEKASLVAEDHMVLHFDKFKDEETMGRKGTIACVLDTKTVTLTLDLGATDEARKQWS
jgi:archaellum biogenesis ATPase FlaH